MSDVELRCKHASIFRTQDDLIESPFQCPTCDRVYDGRDWFATTQLYNAIVDWENLQSEADSLVGDVSFDVDSEEKTSLEEVEEWALDLMDICAMETHQDVCPFGDSQKQFGGIGVHLALTK